MKNNKVSVGGLTEIIRKIAGKEYKSALKEQAEGSKINPAFSRVKDKDEFIDWIMRYYFDPAKNKNKRWWPTQEITRDNILVYLSDPKSNFPLTPAELVDDWYIKGFLKTKMKDISDEELEDLAPKKPQKSSMYHSGEMTLKDIGKETGDLTAAMIQKLEKTGLQKLFKVLDTNELVDMDEDELDAFFSKIFEKIDKVRYETSLEYAKALKDAKGNIKKFLGDLVKAGTITATDVRIISPDEIETLVFLMDKSVEEIAEYLRGDALRDNNKMKSFQAAVAKKVHASKKRGRPRKEKKD